MRPHFKHYNVIFLKNNYSNAYPGNSTVNSGCGDAHDEKLGHAVVPVDKLENAVHASSCRTSCMAAAMAASML